MSKENLISKIVDRSSAFIRPFSNVEHRLTNNEFRFLRIRSETVGFVEAGYPLSAISFYSALLHKKDAATIGAILRAAVFQNKVLFWFINKLKFIRWALQTPFSGILVANEDEDYSNFIENLKSKIVDRYSIFKNVGMNTEHRLTNDEFRFSSNGTCSIGNAPTKQQSFQISPDCSGYNVELAEHYLSGKRDRNSIETLRFRFKITEEISEILK